MTSLSLSTRLVACSRRLPPGLLRFVGRAQFRFPILRRLVASAAKPLRETAAPIAHGPAAGLRFNPHGANPGYVLGTSEPGIQRLVTEHLAQGKTFYDIGANVGFFTVLGARVVGSKGSVVAFEPAPETADALEKNVSMNGFDHVRILRAAVGRESGRAAFATRDKSDSTSARLATVLDAVDQTVVQVEVLSIDDAVETGELPIPDLVKLDVEGAEVEALAGMRTTLERSMPTIICETHGTLTEVRSFLAGLGYALDGVREEGDSAWNAHVVATVRGA